MPALTNLLPITAAPVARSSAVKATPNHAQEQFQHAADTDKTGRAKAAAEAAHNGAGEQDAAPPFADVYEEELQEQRQEASAVATRLSDTESTSPTVTTTLPPVELPSQIALADGGSPLPLTGETLPLTLPGDMGIDNGRLPEASSITDSINTHVLPSAGTENCPVVATPAPGLPTGDPQTPHSQGLQMQGLQQAQTTSADSNFGNPATVQTISTEPGLGESDKLQTSLVPQPGLASAKETTPASTAERAAINEVTDAAASGVEAQTDGTLEPLVANEPSQSASSVQASASAAQSPVIAPLQTEEAILREQATARITDTDLSRSATSVAEQAKDTVWQSQVADRVRAWRGLSGAESTTNLTAGSTTALATALTTQGRHELAMTGSLGGQLQQFAESLRTAVNNPAPVTTTVDSTGVTSTPSGDAAGALRGDGTAGAQQSAGRPGAGGATFQQTLSQSMQSSSFGQPLGQSFGEKSWAESLSQRVTLMAGQKVSSASIELDPPELGAMTVKITVTGDQASVNFASPNALVRDALEQTLPRLQDLLGQQGLQLADANVSDNSAKGRNPGESNGGSGNRGRETASEIENGATTHTVKAPLGLIDYYA